MTDSLGEQVCRDFEQMARTRYIWENYWDEIAALLWPNMRQTFRPGDFKTPGERNHEHQIDSTPQLALARFASIMTSLLTPLGAKWHFIKPSDPLLLKSRRVAEWFERTNDALFQFRSAAEANFDQENRRSYLGLGAFGSTSLFIDKPLGSLGLRYKNVHVGETWFRENHQGQIDTIIRRFHLTARSIVQRWGDAAPKGILTAVAHRPDDEFVIFHRVRPNPDVDPDTLDSRSKKFESVYVAEEGKTVLETGGYNVLPYAVSRYEVAPREIYGRSPAMQAWPAIRTLIVQKRVILTQGHRAVNPVLLTADDGAIPFSLQPGALNGSTINQDGRPLVQALPTGDVNLGRDMMEDERAVINDTFLVSLFQILTETPDRMTATQVLERAQEKSQLLAPSVGQQNQYLGQIIDREIDILAQQGLLAPLPPELIEARNEYVVQYDNPLTQSLRKAEVAGLFRTLENVIPVINVTGDPAPLDHINWDVAAREIAEINAVPVRWLRALEDVVALRQGRDQQAQQAQQAQLGPEVLKAAAAAKKAGLTAADLQ